MSQSLFRGGPFTGRHMLIIMVLFFGVVISVNLTLAFFASQSWTGLVVKNSYVASQNFEKDRAERAAQIARDWDAHVSMKDDFLAVELKDGEGRPVERAKVTAELKGVMFDKDDQTVVLPSLPEGGYGLPVDLHAGAWVAKLTVEPRGVEPWEGSYRFTVPPKASRSDG
ncbi:FixH family protein [Notoacmeibacter ruber]|uniref:Cytochrome oxidase n=1 Tax=Notoacmeibacter ruber TaxID=2670375 RepID=A0A3L7J944_9HYPH|nr:FixH family protein [Notoacmeibacter ruber]RLQ87146.1 hypothetical protein D8780_01865 [Notoacmeibacter ruber]